MEIDITCIDSMVNIDSSDIAYANIKGMYETGDGVGLQLSEHCEPARELIESLCNVIASLHYEKEVKNEICPTERT